MLQYCWILITFTHLIYGVSSDEHSAYDLPESQQMALESSEAILPTSPEAVELTELITTDLRTIRETYQVVSSINHERRWVPGQLLSTRINDELLRKVNESEFGPFVKVESIDLRPIYVVTVMTFDKPYNPITLGRLLKSQFGLASSPNTVYNDGDDITLSYPDKENTNIVNYLFKRGTGSGKLDMGCRTQKDCSQKYYWEFSVSGPASNRSVTLVKDYGEAERIKFL